MPRVKHQSVFFYFLVFFFSLVFSLSRETTFFEPVDTVSRIKRTTYSKFDTREPRDCFFFLRLNVAKSGILFAEVSSV